jgi:cell division protein FtsZ
MSILPMSGRLMEGMGMALMGTGQASGEHRAMEATQPGHLQSTARRGDHQWRPGGVLVNITGGPDLALSEVEGTMNVIHDAADPDANIIFGTVPVEEDG